jgi:hypothetical protein
LYIGENSGNPAAEHAFQRKTSVGKHASHFSPTSYWQADSFARIPVGTANLDKLNNLAHRILTAFNSELTQLDFHFLA